ncbi:hypothetical protein GQ54DRAFT_300995 [Martensiomyces pterosporus]|nr:hypothetical protein GQ54DRAFT_300995 [Martensiomyces pterosporus]
MQAAADALVKLLPPLPSDKRPSAHTSNDGCTTPVKSKHVGAARFEEPFALATLQRYSDLTRVVCDVYHKSVAIREEHIEELSRAVESFERGTDAPPGSLDSDTQLVRLSVWLHSPGLKNAMLADRETSASTLVLSDFDDMLRTELGIDEI